MRAGLPTAITPAGISFVTTAPEPMMTLSPMVTPGLITAAAPIQTRLPIVIFFDPIPDHALALQHQADELP